MKQVILASSVMLMASAPAFSAGIERRGDPSQIVFEDGENYVEFSVTSVDADVSGVARPGTAAAPFGATGDIQDRYQNYALGYKRQVNERLSLAFVIDEPVGADVTYRGPAALPLAGRGAFFGTSFAEVDSVRYTGMARYKATDRVSVYGGPSYVGLSGTLGVVSPATGALDPAAGTPPTPLGTYALSVDKDYRLGYVLGAAYEIPDIALRVALTYESKTEHEFDDNTGTPFEVELPQAVTLHAQTGIAADTLLFGSVRWREWSQFKVAPLDFFPFEPAPTLNADIAFGTDDIFTYRLGIGRRINENWSGAVILGHEPQHDNEVGNLEGTDGYISYTLALTHETESWDITGALSYIDLGNAVSNATSFSGNDAVAFGLKVGLRF